MRIITSSNDGHDDITSLSIDWNKVAEKMAELEEGKEEKEEKDIEIEVKDKEEKEGKTGEKEEDKEKCDEEECKEEEDTKEKDDDAQEEKEACKEKTITASEAVGVCDKCGIYRPCSHDLANAANEMEYKAMVRRRIMRREAAIRELEELQKQKLKEVRSNLRRKILSYIYEQEEGDKDMKQPEQHGKFIKVNESDLAKKAFVEFAKRQGWPEEYIRAMVGRLSTRDIPESVKKVLASSLPKEEKKNIIVAMYKDAKLSKEEAERIYRYWKEELGYQDEEWIKDLVKNYE